MRFCTSCCHFKSLDGLVDCRGMKRISRILCLGVLLLDHQSNAKKVSGDVTLDGSRTERLLTKFAIPRSSEIMLTLALTIPESRGMYVDERMLRVHVFSEKDWSLARRAVTCANKVQHAMDHLPVTFDLVKPLNRGGNWKAVIEKNVTVPESYSSRTSFWYFMLDDCSLEQSFHRASEAPKMDFTLVVQSKRRQTYGGHNAQYVESHLSADQEGLGSLLVLKLILSGFLCMIMLYRILQSRSGATIHVAQIIVLLVVTFETLSTIFELLHLGIYMMNGFGNYFFDALSGQMEALCDGMIAIVLLYVGSGWTLPQHVVNLSGDVTSSNKNKNHAPTLFSSVFLGLRCPKEQDKLWWITPGFVLAIHVALAQWSRTFNDDFDSYHSLEHASGKALMWIRFMLGFVFISGTNALRQSGRCPRSLNTFLTKFIIVGVAWFISLPFVSMLVRFIFVKTWEHRALTIGSTVVQLSSIASLVWLFSSNSEASAYHRVSRIGATYGEDDLADLNFVSTGKAAPKRLFQWGNTKIRLD